MAWHIVNSLNHISRTSSMASPLASGDVKIGIRGGRVKRLIYLWGVYRDFKSRVIIAMEYLFNPAAIGNRLDLERTINDRITRENPN